MAVRRTFLQLALIDVLFLIALGVLGARYHGHVHPAGNVAIAMVLAVFCISAVYALRLAYTGRKDSGHIAFAANVCPAIGIAGVASGFLIALSGSTGDIQQRVVGASSGLAATIVAISCMVILDLQAHMLREPNRGCGCGKG